MAALVEQVTGSEPDLSLEAIGAMTVRVPDVGAALEALEDVEGVSFVEKVTRSRSLAFVPNDPLTSYQWYLDAVQAFTFWDLRPALAPVRVAIVDSGIDMGHPEFAGRVVGAKSFVPGEGTEDTVGHGTLVAGEVGAALDNGEGIAGVGISAELLIAKVVAPDGSISLEAEAKAIRWAVDRGARVINLSLGGLRDPRDPSRDQYSALEQAAIEYARSNGAVVVAAAGNCDLPGECPYPYASYPAALSHVVGVGALNPTAGVPTFSNRDPRYVDLGAPGRADRVDVPVRAHLPDLRASRLLALRVERPDRRERHLVLGPTRLGGSRSRARALPEPRREPGDEHHRADRDRHRQHREGRGLRERTAERPRCALGRSAFPRFRTPATRTRRTTTPG